MTIYYKKINLNISVQTFDLTKLKGDKLFEYGNNIKYFQIVDDAYLDSIFGNIFKIPPVKTYLVQTKDRIRPHTDNGVVSCLNYYISTQGFVTNFWKANEKIRRLVDTTFNGVTKRVVGYAREDITLVDSFTANDNDAYLLNIGQIHSVDGSSPAEPRTMLQFQWGPSTKIEELIEKLEF